MHTACGSGLSFAGSGSKIYPGLPFPRNEEAAKFPFEYYPNLFLQRNNRMPVSIFSISEQFETMIAIDQAAATLSVTFYPVFVANVVF